ncbi:MAG TPA: ABC transporter permease [Nitrospiria bacterium]|jgi:putative ABC transport system permease protein
MMLRWAWKTLIRQRGGLFGSAGGLAGAFILVIFFSAVFRGEATQIVAYLENTRPDIWVMQRGVSNMHMATSFVYDWKADKIARLPGVKRVTPIVYLNTIVHAGDQDAFSFIVGLQEGSSRAGPWALAGGRSQLHSGETVIPEVLSKLSGVGIGDSVTITDRSFKIVGLSEETYSMANSVTFVSMSDLTDILSAFGTYSYLLVDLEEGIDARGFTKTIMDEIEKVNAMTHGDFVRSDFALGMMMGGEIIFMMTVICSGLAVLILGFTSYTQVMRKRRELAIAKAVGIRNLFLYTAVVFHAMVITLLALLLTGIFAIVFFPFISTLVPQVTLVVSIGDLAGMAVVAIIVAAISALIPAYLVSRLDPATVFQV